MSEASSLWPFSERNGSAAPTAIETLLAEPEYLFDDTEKAELHAFAEQLVHGERFVEGLPDLAIVHKTSIANASQSFYPEYFYTDQGKSNLEVIAIDPQSSETDIRANLFSLVAHEEAPNLKTRRDISTASTNWYKDVIRERLLQVASADAEQPDSAVLYVNFAPEKILHKFGQLQLYRSLYRTIHQELQHDSEGNIGTAKQVLLDLHVARVNNLVAEMYPNILHLAEQLEASPQTEKVQEWQSELYEMAPVIKHAFTAPQALENFGKNFTRRLDLLRNGAYSTGDPTFTPLDQATLHLADQIDNNQPNGIAEHGKDIPDGLIEVATTTTWNAVELQEFLEGMLVEWQLLSESRLGWEEVSDRSGPPEDKKWQVVISPRVTSLSVDGVKNVLAVPESFKRKLIEQGAGALAVAAHELVHVLQNESDKHLAKAIPLAGIKGRRTSTMREMGGIYEERQVLAMFGFGRPTNTTYLHALEAKLAGQNQTEVARAFLTASMREGEASESYEEKTKIAAKNILRLYRRGGNDSQALDYIEQDLLQQNLSHLSSDQIRAIVTSGSSFSLQDAAALHAVSLFDVPTHVEHRPAQEVVAMFQRKYQPKSS